MTLSMSVYRTRPGFANVSPLSAKREWMDATWEAHAYKCFPVSLSNQLGWGISFPEDISFIWDGVSDTEASHVTVLSGHSYVSTSRANATISFNTGLRFVTSPDISLLAMPAPNYFIDGVSAFTTLITTSFYMGELPVAWRITRPNTEITVKANTPVISVLPINLLNLQGSELIERDVADLTPSDFLPQGYSEEVTRINLEGEWSNFYRNATDHVGTVLGEHQVKTIKLKGGSVAP